MSPLRSYRYTKNQDWNLPTPPICQKCGKTSYAVAYNTGDGWALSWDCYCGNMQDEEIPWAWGDDWLWPEDLKELGFTIV